MIINNLSKCLGIVATLMMHIVYLHMCSEFKTLNILECINLLIQKISKKVRIYKNVMLFNCNLIQEIIVKKDKDKV